MTTLPHPSRVPMPFTPGHRIAGKYIVLDTIGQGGMGVVVAARHESLEQKVAIKLLTSQSSPDSEERFIREARLAARLESAHIARVMDVGVLPTGMPYMVMEYLEGNDLGAEVDHRGFLPVPEAVDYVLEAIDAIAEAHSLGIVHRDLKPSNVFLARRGDGARTVKVLDFGISKAAASGTDETQSRHAITSTNASLGSPLYMSPEQVRSARSVDHRSDIWSLGVILHELITGDPPFMAESIPELFVEILHGKIPRPSSLRPEIPSALDEVILRCLLRDRSHRFGSVAELACALVPFGGGRALRSVERACTLLPQTSSSDHPSAPKTVALPSSRRSLDPSPYHGAPLESDLPPPAQGAPPDVMTGSQKLASSRDRVLSPSDPVEEAPKRQPSRNRRSQRGGASSEKLLPKKRGSSLPLILPLVALCGVAIGAAWQRSSLRLDRSAAAATESSRSGPPSAPTNTVVAVLKPEGVSSSPLASGPPPAAPPTPADANHKPAASPPPVAKRSSPKPNAPASSTAPPPKKATPEGLLDSRD